MLGSSVVLSPGLNAGSASWLTVITGLAMASPMVWIVIKLTGDYPGKTLVEINDVILGPLCGKIFSFMYLWYFFHLGAIVLRDFGDFMSTIMRVTPPSVFLLITTALVAYLVRNGIEVMARCSLIIVIFSFLLLPLVFILVSNNIDLANLLPINSIGAGEFLKANYEVTIFPFGEIIVFTMIIKSANDYSKIKRSIITALALTCMFGTIFNVYVISGLGNNLATATYPGYEVIRRVDIFGIITRIDVVGATADLALGVLKASVILYAVALGIAQIFKLRSYTSIVLPLGTLMFLLSLIQFNSSIENFIFHERTYLYYAVLFQAFLPALTLTIDRIKKALAGRTARASA